MTVVYQGEPGAYSEAAAAELFPEATLRGLPTVRRAVEAVAAGEAARAVLPLENALFGSVPEVLDTLAEAAERHGVRIVAEHWFRVELMLLARRGTALADVREVRSHPQALGQAAPYLDANLPGATRTPTPDTAGAARELARHGSDGAAVLASRRAAELYGLEVLAEHVEADGRNYTRFVAVAPADADVAGEGPPKTSLVLTPSPQSPNALFRALTAFVGRRLAVHRVEPRPRRGRPGQYHYHVDVDGDAGAEPLQGALADARAFCDRLLVLGSYPARPAP